jgi:hypothetical protein
VKTLSQGFFEAKSVISLSSVSQEKEGEEEKERRSHEQNEHL